MILSTHAIASLFPSHPTLAVVAGFASHFAFDAIPHWDYPLRSITVGNGADNRRLSIRTVLKSALHLTRRPSAEGYEGRSIVGMMRIQRLVLTGPCRRRSW
jgi:hypothetical protein